MRKQEGANELQLPGASKLPPGNESFSGGGGRDGVAENDPEALVVTGESQS